MQITDAEKDEIVQSIAGVMSLPKQEALKYYGIFVIVLQISFQQFETIYRQSENNESIEFPLNNIANTIFYPVNIWSNRLLCGFLAMAYYMNRTNFAIPSFIKQIIGHLVHIHIALCKYSSTIKTKLEFTNQDQLNWYLANMFNENDLDIICRCIYLFKTGLNMDDVLVNAIATGRAYVNYSNSNNNNIEEEKKEEENNDIDSTKYESEAFKKNTNCNQQNNQNNTDDPLTTAVVRLLTIGCKAAQVEKVMGELMEINEINETMTCDTIFDVMWEKLHV